MSTTPTSPFSDTAAAFDDRLPGADRERGRGDELITINATTLSKLLVVVLMATAIGVGVVGQRMLAYDREEFWGLVYWGIALAFFVAGLWQAWRIAPGTNSRPAENPALERTLPLSMEAALLILVLGVGVFFRFYRIDSIPPGLNHDAGWFGLYGIRITHGAGYTPFAACCGAVGNETMFLYIIAFFQLLLGPIQFAIQLAALTVGLATLVAFYFFMRRLFDLRLALVATFLLGVSGWHMTFSKAGWTAILVPLFVCLTFYFLVKAVQERRRRDFVLAGIFLGLSLDTYSGARMLPFVAAAYLLYEIVRTPSLLRRQYVDLALFGVAALVAFSPLGWYMVRHWDLYSSHSNSLWIGRQIKDAGSYEPLFANIKNALLMFNFRGHGDDFYVQEPLLDMPVSVFFTLGLVYSLLRVRQRPYFLLLVLLVLTMAIGVASTPNGNRVLGAVLATTAFAAVFLFEAWRWLAEAYARARDLSTMALVGALMFTGWATYDNYLGPSLPNVHFARQDEQWGFYPETTRVGRYMHDVAGKNYMIHAAAGNWPRDALTYLSYQGHGDPFKKVYTYTDHAADLLSVPPEANRGTVYIVENTPDNSQVIALLHQEFPKAETDNIYYPDGTSNILAYAIRVPPGEGSALGPFVIPGAAEADAGRTSELQQLVTALTAYRDKTGSYPDTANNIQTACVYRNLDKLCVALNTINADVFLDPRNEGTNYGYWYRSDGTSFTLFALYEGDVPPGNTCSDEEKKLIHKPRLTCVHGGG